MRIVDFRITRIQFPRDRVIGDNQVRTEMVSVAALELNDQNSRSGLGFMKSLFAPMPAQAELERFFLQIVWSGLDGPHPAGIVQRIIRPRGGNLRPQSLPAHKAMQVALWDLLGKQVGLPLWQILAGVAPKPVPTYAGGLGPMLTSARCSGRPMRWAIPPSR